MNERTFINRSPDFHNIPEPVETGPESYSREQLVSYAKIKGGESINLTNVSPELKNTITEWQGSIIDNSDTVSYRDLKTIGGSFDTHTKSSVNLPNLETIGGNLSIMGASSVEAPVLENVHGNIIYAPNPQQNPKYTHSFDLPNLKIVGGHLSAAGVSVFHAPELLTVGSTIDARHAIDFEASALRSVKKLNAPSAVALKVPKLESVTEIHLSTKTGKKSHLNEDIDKTKINLPEFMYARVIPRKIFEQKESY